jgi:hypothetical protein
MGEVYEAEHVEQGRRVAIKVLNQRLASAQDRARFLREGQLAASISHPKQRLHFRQREISGTPVIAMVLPPGRDVERSCESARTAAAGRRR